MDEGQKAALKKALGRSKEDLMRPLTPETKVAALHGLDTPAKEK